MKLSSLGETREVRLEGDGARLDGRPVPFRRIPPSGALSALAIGDRVDAVRAAREGGRVFVWCRSGVFEFRLAAGRAVRSGEHAGDLLAPMPGRLRRVCAAAGQPVRKGDVVVILEAMKMEHAIRAPRDGLVARVFHREGDLVNAGAMLAEIN